MIQISSVFGVYGLSFFTVLFILFISIFFVNLKDKKVIFLFSGLFIFLFVYIFGHVRLKNSDLEEYSNNIFRIIQPNISQKDKLNYNKIQNNYKKMVNLNLFKIYILWI